MAGRRLRLPPGGAPSRGVLTPTALIRPGAKAGADRVRRAFAPLKRLGDERLNRIEQALAKGVREALLRHKLAGNPVAA